mmetsp:Transcript_1838/g.4287  ORF Transcript_1838/g.4287 Transcript_1838/m.4287 type:complete len:221 (-) Transcript_1838:986-1648(-)
MHHSPPILSAESRSSCRFRTERTNGISGGIPVYGLGWCRTDEQRVGGANRSVSLFIGTRDEIEFLARIDPLVAPPQNHDAPAGPANTNASSLCDWTIRNDILGTQFVAHLPAGRRQSMLCGDGTETGGRDFRLYDIVDNLQLFYELLHAPGLDSDGSALSDAGGNSVPGRIHRSGRKAGISLVSFVHALHVDSGALSSSGNALRIDIRSLLKKIASTLSL